ncbi:MAG: transcription-repair coupling factor [Deltaproteobacteria bacterium]|nr:MAG: transcription-repair coupling factor [Deltaproteobacteria bacterium]
MTFPLPRLSFEHVALALAKRGTSPCVQWMRIPPGARSFLAARLFERLGRTLLYLCAGEKEAEEATRELTAYLGPDAVLPFPSVEATPYEPVPPHLPSVHDRMRALHRLLSGPPAVVVAPIAAAAEKTLPPEAFIDAVDGVSPGDTLDVDAFAARLVTLGYSRLPVAADPGDFAVRGGIVDVYSPAHPLPARLLLDGDVVESVRWFHPSTQRTVAAGARADGESGHGERLVILPCSQVITRGDFLSAACEGLAPERGLAPEPYAWKEALRQGIRFHGADALLPRLYGYAAPVFSYLPADALVVVVDSVECVAAARNAFEEAEENFAFTGEEEGYPAPPELVVPEAELVSALSRLPMLAFDWIEVPPFGRDEPLRGDAGVDGNEEIRRSTATASSEGLLYPLAEEAKAWWKRGDRFIVSSLSPSQVDRMEDFLSRYAVPLSRVDSLREALSRNHGVFLCGSEVTRGFRAPELRAAIVTESEIFGEKVRARRPRKERIAVPEEFSLADLRVNDPAVHVDHGIGIYRGLLRRVAAGIEGDYLVLEYAGGDRLFVPVEKMSRVQRYVASEEGRAQLSRLGGTAWQRAKRKVRDDLLAMAQELVDLQAKRQLAEKAPVPPPDAVFREFEAAFPHEETPDQEQVIREVLSDLSSSRPMDRLVCGDVGYGKTEVAIRAAFQVVTAGKQAAVLVPTTLLAEQHFQTFTRRLAGYPVRVANLSRFGTRKDQAAVVKGVANGTVDVVIGTHRLLQRDVTFQNLGLVVIDEEQRFGVAHKERLKRMRAAVDVLTLSATPIPRTLHMAFSGIRDVSLIATPPEDRLSIRTFVVPFSGDTIREAVEREIRRGGQVFFVHNRVQTLPAMERYLRELLPDARIAVGHGQMDEEALSAAMDDFASRRADILLCTAIIEAGLDLPNANTIVVNLAHRFGLAQLYQLRGRVGRDRHRAYAYFVIPKDVALTRDATRRLAVLEELTELGSGFRIASHDLEIRGAGNLLGKDQSGQIHQVGFELYTQLLSETVAEISGIASSQEEEPELELRVPAFLPDDYIDEAGERLEFYRKLSSAKTVDDADEIEMELLDRFGRLPVPARALCELARMRSAMRTAGVAELKRGAGSLFLTLSAHSPFDRAKLVSWVTRERKTFSFVRGEILAMRLPGQDPSEVLGAAKNLLSRFGAGSTM